MTRLLWVLLCAPGLFAAVNFDREIRPILSDNCFACHGPDEKQRIAALHFDTKEGAARAIVPGKSNESKLYQRISAAGPRRMPPPASGHSLTPAQIETIRKWIDEGAVWETHWAYLAPKRPAVPKVTKNPIDAFVLARLEKEGVKPSPEADKITLLRRVSFDLTGLPPAPAEMASFLADKSPDAYEKRVDQLLQSPRWGERMAMVWLDLARYADTHGYHIDSHRDMWHWRDWVINAFNRNMPYDRFTIEQLAGDLLPDATLEQKIATGFNRNHMINFEGGAIPEEYQNEYVVDRVETTSVTWMGMTMGCARCHDHKYDPIKQREFYQFYAFFNNIPEKGLDGQKGNAAPVVQIPSPEQAHEVERLTAEIASLKAKMPEAELKRLQAAWENEPKLPEPSRDGLVAHYEFDGNVADSSGHYRHARVLKGDPAFSAQVVGRGADFDGSTEIGFVWPKLPRFTAAFWTHSSGNTPMAIVRGESWEVRWDKSEKIAHLMRGASISAQVNGIAIRTRRMLPTSSKEAMPRPWYHVVLEWDGSAPKLWINGQLEPVEPGESESAGLYKGQLDDLRVYDRPLNAREIEQLAIDEPERATIALTKRSKEQSDRLRDYFLTHAAPEEWRANYAALRKAEASRRDLEASIPTSMVMQEMEKPRETAVLGRGDYRNRGEIVHPGVPAVLPPLPKGAPLNRLTLARWLVDPSHPLTARVAVNRFWQTYFGTGIVKTAQDFGSQGDPPSHPELLDWLATEFIRTRWDMKAMAKLIVTSATYKQSSKSSPELNERDPENRLLARGPRFRLPAEMVRDNALYIAGLLDERIGGPSVFPYQPKGLWEEIAYGDVFSAQEYHQSHGKDLYRKSIYTFWKRTSSPPELITFDAPDREKCTARRSTTNTPLQALVLMNDPAFVEAARALAGRMMHESPDPKKRIAYGFELATGRRPNAKEADVLRGLLRTETADYRANPDAAAKLVHVGESAAQGDARDLAAWTTVASVILNLDETITKE